jgi:hypothetical protein
MSFCGIPQVCNNYFNLKLYTVVKTGCKLAGGCKIINLLEMFNGEVKILSCKIKLLK